MPRTKGAKNKNNATIAGQIAAVKAEIEALNASLKAKKAELKKLEAAEEDEKKEELLKAIKGSGKSIDEVIKLIKG